MCVIIANIQEISDPRESYNPKSASKRWDTSLRSRWDSIHRFPLRAYNYTVGYHYTLQLAIRSYTQLRQSRVSIIVGYSNLVDEFIPNALTTRLLLTEMTIIEYI